MSLIKKTGTYMTTAEITSGLSIGSGTLLQHGISVKALNERCDYYSHGMMKGSSVFERRIGDILNKYFQNVESHVGYEDCLSPRGFPLEFDFRISGILVEADGNQHKPGNLLYDPYLAQCDEIKNSWCENNGMPLIRIGYRYNVTEKYVLKCLVESLANHNVAGNGRRDGSENCGDMDNQPPSRRNVLSFVLRKVQRLTGEDTQTNNPDTSARRSTRAMR